MNTTDYEFNKKYNEAQNLFQTSYFLNSNGIFDCLNSPLKGGTSRFYEDKTNVIVFAPPSWMEQHKEVENVIDTVIADESTYNEQQTIDQDDLSCTGILAGRFGQLLKSVFNLIKTITPIIIVVLTFVDFVKALVSQDQKEFNKSIQKFIKRLIIGVLIFVLPTVLELILKLAGIPYGTCGIR